MEKNKTVSISPEENQRRIRSAFTRFARMSEWDSEDSRFITLALKGRMDKFLVGALEAAIITPKETGAAAVYPAIEQAFVAEMQEKLDLGLIAELYNRIPRETVALQGTATEVAGSPNGASRSNCL